MPGPPEDEWVPSDTLYRRRPRTRYDMVRDTVFLVLIAGLIVMIFSIIVWRIVNG